MKRYFSSIAIHALFLTVLCGPGWLPAQDDDAASTPDPAEVFRAAAESVDSDLKTELEKLAALRQEIAAEKPRVAKETREIAFELREKKRRAELAKQDRDALIYQVESLDRKVRLWRDEAAYIDSLLADFEKQRQAQAGVAAFQGMLDGEATDAGTALDKVSASVQEWQRVQEQGGRVIAGRALDKAGEAHDGKFVEVGPLAWFVADQGALSGLVQQGADLNAEVVNGTGDADTIRALANGEKVSAPFDPTLGAALALNEVEGGFVEHIRQGGLWIWPILLLAVIAIGAALVKWLQIARIRDISPTVVRRVLDAVNSGDREKALTVTDEVRHPAAGLLKRGIAEVDLPKERVEESLYEEFVAARPPLLRGLPFIAIASATAPLLGLLGTVTGMIGTFQRIRIFGTSDTNVIAGGISEALVTTEVGLAVAIPALIIHALLSRRVQGICSAMEMTSLAFVNGLKTGDDSAAEKDKGAAKK